MPIIPQRNLGKLGVVTDVSPYDLPPEAWSLGCNVRFRNGSVSRAPVFRNVKALYNAEPRFVCGTRTQSGRDRIFIGYNTGRVTRLDNTVETDVSIAGYATTIAEAVYSTTSLANVIYLNRPDRAPWAYRPSDNQFVTLANWDASWRTNLLRVCGGALVALNVTKGAVTYPTMVKTSSFPQSGSVPASWDQTVANTLASENILAEMRGPIVDASSLGDALVVYGKSESWLMSANGDTSVFSYRKLPYNKGAINANCSIEIEGKHYVFGTDDVWMHDGYTETSICDGKTRDFIFNGLNLSRAALCFVAHNAKLKDLHFCYQSGDRAVRFLNTPQGCNRQATFNYGNNTWSFDDLPMVHSADQVNLNVSVTYGSITGTYATVGGTYLDQEDGYKRTLAYVGTASSPYTLAPSLYAFDLFGPGSTVVFPVDTNATGPVTLEKTGIDLDQLGAELRGYKTCSSLYPQARLDPEAVTPLVFEMGASDYFGRDAVYDASQTYDGNALYKLDYRTAGRYLSLRVTYSDYRPFTLTAIDFDFNVQGSR